MLNNVVINNFLKNFGYYSQERNRSVVSYGGLIARFVDGFYQVCTPFQGKVVLGETQREKVVEGLIESYRTMLQNHRTDAITSHCTSRALRPLNTSSSLKITASMKELGLVNSLVDGNGNELAEKTE